MSVVDHVIDAASGTFRVRLELPNPDNRLPAGLKCVVSVEPGVGAESLAASGEDALVSGSPPAPSSTP